MKPVVLAVVLVVGMLVAIGLMAWVVGMRVEIGDVAEIAITDAGRPSNTRGAAGSTCRDPIWAYGTGQYPDPPTGANRFGEVWDRERMWFAWTQDGLSQPASVQGRLRKCADVSL